MIAIGDTSTDITMTDTMTATVRSGLLSILFKTDMAKQLSNHEVKSVSQLTKACLCSPFLSKVSFFNLLFLPFTHKQVFF